MPRKKGLGKTVETALELMNDLVKDLEKFGTKTSRKTLKKTVSSSPMEDKDKDALLTKINEASETALSLSNTIDDIRDAVKEIKPKKNSRFARDVVARFLESEI